MKLKLFIVTVLFCLSVTAKSQCVITHCVDSLSATTTSDTLNMTFTGFIPTSITITQLSGKPTSFNPSIANSVVSGLQPDQSYVFMVVASAGNTTTTSFTRIVTAPAPCPICPPPPPQKTATKVDLVLRVITYNDGSTSTF